MTVYAGRHNTSWVLPMLFVLWVLAPYLAMTGARRLSRRRTVPARKTLDAVMLILPLVTLALYATVALGPPRPQAAFIFVVVPPVFCLVIAIAVGLDELFSRQTKP